jgi:hypothetical protein
MGILDLQPGLVAVEIAVAIAGLVTVAMPWK